MSIIYRYSSNRKMELIILITLVGYTGFVGSNICENMHIDKKYNSKNVIEAYGTNPDLLIYAGVRAEKFLANQDEKLDFEVVKEAFNNIKKINPKKLVLISTIDVYKNPNNVNEDSEIVTEKLHPYGLNRYKLEQWVKNEFDTLIVRLPGLYGKNIKKNFIYDYINIIPKLLNEKKYEEIIYKNPFIKDYYIKDKNSFYRCKNLSLEEKKMLKKFFFNIGFSALNFTDSRGLFQFYNLKYLSKHIDLLLKNNVKLANLPTEPISIKELYQFVSNKTFENEFLSKDKIPYYNFKTKYTNILGGENGYIYDKRFILNDIKSFIKEYSNEDIYI